MTRPNSFCEGARVRTRNKLIITLSVKNQLIIAMPRTVSTFGFNARIERMVDILLESLRFILNNDQLPECRRDPVVRKLACLSVGLLFSAFIKVLCLINY